MASVKVSFEGKVDIAQMFIDDVLMLVGEGTASRNLDPGEHALTFFIRGTPGTKYTASITAPASAQFTHTATLDSSTKDAQLHWFTLNGGGGQ